MLLQTEELSKAFGGVAAVDAVSVGFEAGAVHALIGPNGAGKTTLLNLLCGIYRSSRGRILFEGRDLTGCATHEYAAAGIGRTFQNLQVFFNMTALENVMAGRHLLEPCGLAAAALRLPARVREERACRLEAEALLEFVGLASWRDTPADSMPYGALKRLEIARALAARPKLLLLDEPAAGLNPAETAAIDQLIHGLVTRRVTVVLVEHNMKLVMGVAQHVVVLDYGRVLAEGEPSSVRSNPRVIEAYLGAEAQ